MTCIRAGGRENGYDIAERGQIPWRLAIALSEPCDSIASVSIELPLARALG